MSDNLYDVRYNVYDVCGKTCDEIDNVYDVRDKTSENGVPTCGEGVPTVREGDFVEIYGPPGSGAPSIAGINISPDPEIMLIGCSVPTKLGGGLWRGFEALNIKYFYDSIFLNRF